MQQQHIAPNTIHLTFYYTDVNQVTEASPNLRLFSPDERRILVGLGLHERSHETNSIFLDALYRLNERDFPDERVHHCVRCHESFLTRNNSRRACVLPGGSTVRHTTSTENVSYGAHFARCNGPPDHCTTVGAVMPLQERSHQIIGDCIFFDERDFPDEPVHHCVRCHERFLTRNNNRWACLLPEGSTVWHTTSVEDVPYGTQFARCNGPPDHCTAVHPRSAHFRRGGR